MNTQENPTNESRDTAPKGTLPTKQSAINYWPIGTANTVYVAHAFRERGGTFRENPSNGSRYKEKKALWYPSTVPLITVRSHPHTVCSASVYRTRCGVSWKFLKWTSIQGGKDTWLSNQSALNYCPIATTPTIVFVAHRFRVCGAKFRENPSSGGRYKQEKALCSLSIVS